MRKIGFFLLSIAATVMVAAMPVFAQPGAANEAAARQHCRFEDDWSLRGFCYRGRRRRHRPVEDWRGGL